jgi:hypothetical protein
MINTHNLTFGFFVTQVPMSLDWFNAEVVTAMQKNQDMKNSDIKEVSMIEILVGLFVMLLLDPEKSQKHREEIVPIMINDESAASDSDATADVDDHIEF